MKEDRKRRNEEAGNSSLKKQKTDALQSEDFINFVSEPPTLQNIVIISIGTRLWMQSEVIRKLKGYFFRTFPFLECCSKLEEKVLNQPAKDFLPFPLKIEVSNTIRPIGLQLSKWFNYELQKCSALKELRLLHCSIYWTMEGTLDMTRSLEEFIKNGIPTYMLVRLYELACRYCLENYLSDIWKRMPPYKKTYTLFDRSSEDDIVLYWSLAISNKLSSMFRKFDSSPQIYSSDFSIHQNMISWSVSFGNSYALKYFWKKVTEMEINAGIVTWLKKIVKVIDSTSQEYTHLDYNPNTYILCFLLSHLKDECQQKEIFKNHSYVILKSLFRSWPFQKFFLPSMLTMMNFLQENVYVSIMTDVVDRIGLERNTEKIFRSIWSSSPTKLKDVFLEENNPLIIKLLMKLIKVDDMYFALIILQDTSLEKKKWIASHLLYNLDFKEFLTSRKDLDFIEPILKEIFLEYENIQSYKLKVLLHYTQDCSLSDKLIEQGNFQAVDAMLKWAFQSLRSPFSIQSLIHSFKKKVFDPLRISSSLICHADYDHIDRFLKWYFNSKEEILEFEKTFLGEDNLCHFKEILFKFAPLWNGWDHFEKFRNLLLSASENMIGFKKKCLECVKSVVEKRFFAFASRLLNWCLDNPQEVNRFKNDLLFSESGIKGIISANPSTWEQAKDLLMWSFPLSRETVTELELLLNLDKEHLDSYGHLWKSKRRDFFQLLDNVVRVTGTE